MIKTQHILSRLLRDRFRQTFCLPNYTPVGWFENDLMQITKAGYWVEFEIKVSLWDFRADKLKGGRSPNRRIPWLHRKWEYLAGNYGAIGPNRFYFCIPEDLKDAIEPELPDWAGLICFRRPIKIGRVLIEHKIKEAPLRHRNKPEPSIVEHARSVLYYRLMDKIIKDGLIVEG